MAEEDKLQGAPAIREITHNDRQVKIREGENIFELSINGFPLKVSRQKDGKYHSAILTHQAFDSAEELARALAETEGKLWVAGPGNVRHRHTPHKPEEPHGPEH